MPCLSAVKNRKRRKIKTSFYSCMNRLVEMANDYGFRGDLWNHYLTWLLVNHENAFSVSCEITGLTHSPSLNALALHDFAILRIYFIWIFLLLKAFTERPPAVI